MRFPKGVNVHPWTWQVMKAAKQFAEESHGTFRYYGRSHAHQMELSSWSRLSVQSNRDLA